MFKNNLLDNLDEAPIPWGNRKIVSASGIIGGGWTNENKFVLINSDGYLLANPITGEVELRRYDLTVDSVDCFSKDNLEYTIEELETPIKVFGLRGGNGNHLTPDMWHLDSFHPSLGVQVVGITNCKKSSNEKEYWRTFTLLRLMRLEYSSLRFGFSPNERSFVILGIAGAEFFSRD